MLFKPQWFHYILLIFFNAAGSHCLFYGMYFTFVMMCCISRFGAKPSFGKAGYKSTCPLPVLAEIPTMPPHEASWSWKFATCTTLTLPSKAKAPVSDVG